MSYEVDLIACNGMWRAGCGRHGTCAETIPMASIGNSGGQRGGKSGGSKGRSPTSNPHSGSRVDPSHTKDKARTDRVKKVEKTAKKAANKKAAKKK